jgi:hypothetical protein
MNAEERIRTTIIGGLRAGRSVCEIVRFNNFKKSTILDVKNCYDEFISAGGKPDDFSSERKQHRGEATPWSATRCRPCRNLVNQNPGRYMRSLARELGVSKKTVRNRMQQDIRYKSYAMRRGSL